ncbi:MAG: DUF1559 domain-containing protein [Planctomycetia bacterium]|nr:DUF1559 domain-containing protein [Planctomycetia bacterium]
MAAEAHPGGGSANGWVVVGVVAFISLVCGGVALRAASHLREARNHMHCVSRLKSMGIALHTFNDSVGYLPSEHDPNRPTFYKALLPFMEAENAADNAPMVSYLCPSRRDVRTVPGKRDYGYASSDGETSVGTSVLDAPELVNLGKIINGRGTTNTLLLSHLWLDPDHYTGGDPTDLGWATKNNSRTISQPAIPDDNPAGSNRHIGGPHTRGLPSLFADAHVGIFRYDYPNFSQVWAYDNRDKITSPP